MDRERKKDSAQLAVVGIIRQSANIVLQRHKKLLKTLGLPILLLAALDSFPAIFFEDNNLLAFGFFLLSLLIFVPYASCCHRLVIMKDQPDQAVEFVWTARETRFLGWTLAIYFLAASAHLAGGVLWQALSSVVRNVGLISGIFLVFTLVILPGFYLLARLSLVFPGTAVGERPDIKSVWTLSNGNVFQLIMIVVIYPLLTSFFLYLFITKILLTSASTLASVVYSVSFYLFTLFIISALSTAFVELKKLVASNQQTVEKAG